MTQNLGDEMLASCPTPEKHRYLDEATAIQQAKSYLASRRRLKGWQSHKPASRAYLCRCRFWHLTSRTAA